MLPKAKLPELSALEAAKTDEILAVFEEQDEFGNYIHSDQDARHLIPALLLVAGHDPNSFEQGPLKALFGEFREKFGLDFDSDPAAWEKAAVAYYQKNPPKKGLLSKIQQIFS